MKGDIKKELLHAIVVNRCQFRDTCTITMWIPCFLVSLPTNVVAIAIVLTKIIFGFFLCQIKL
jgi:hypothetical protein